MTALCLVFLQIAPNLAFAVDTNLKKAVEASEAHTKAPLISRERFLTRAVVGPAYLSPNGRYAVHFERTRKRIDVVLTDAAKTEAKILFTTKDVRNARWANDSHHVYFNVGNGIAVSDIRTSNTPRLVFKFDDLAFDRMLGTDPKSAAHFYVSKYDKKTKDHALVRLSVEGGAQELYRSRYRIRSILDPLNEDRLFLSLILAKNPAIVELQKGETREILTCAYDETCVPVYYDKEIDELTVAANMTADLGHLATVGLSNGDLGVKHSDPLTISDLAGYQIDPLSGIPLVAQYQYGYEENYGLTPYAVEHTTFIEEAFGSEANLTIYPRGEGANWLVTARFTNRRERAHFFYDPHTKIIKPILPVSNVSGALNETILANRLPFSFQASDGVTIYAYLTLPRGIRVSDAPLITLPHGGPWGRDDGTFDLFAQFLANRGYIVYQPNFRSSEGFGREFTNSIDGDFGDGRVQDDIIDGLKYLLDSGIGHKDKLGIFGHSFGGFSTLAGLTFTPDLFKVGIAGAPPADLSGTFLRIATKGKFLRNSPLASAMFSHRLGDVDDTERMERMHKNSPLFHVSKINKPLLIIAGKQDDRVSSDEVLDYALKLEALGKKVSLVMAEDEGHSYRSEAGQQAYFYLLEKTLAQYLSGRFEPLSDQDKNSVKIKRFIAKSTLIDQISGGF